MKYLLKALPFLGLAVILSSCGRNDRSATTNWKMNDTKWGGFETKQDYAGQETPPNMVLIPGGNFVMGFTEEDVPYDWDNIPRRVTVSTFFMDRTEISNADYLLYLDWTNLAYGESYPEVYLGALPDTLVWRDELSYNEPYVENYLRHPATKDHPVVGVSWRQAREYARWRTDRVNEAILIDKGILNPNPAPKDDQVFVTDSYFAGQYTGDVRKGVKDLRTGGDRQVRKEDGMLQPEFRLPTEAEWEYAALALPGLQANEKDENYTDRRIYPWSGNSMRYQRHDRYQGQMYANFKRRGGDYMGIAGKPNDGSSVTTAVTENFPNDFGLYNMAGNVNEWVEDLYRPLTSQTLNDFENHDLNSFRGNDFRQLKRDPVDGRPLPKDSLGRLQYEYVDDADAAERDNYKKGRVFNYLDGDDQSEAEYATNEHTLISDKARVYKGGSWADRAYWLSPGTRRFMDEDKSSRTVGFRCAMISVGGDSSVSGTGRSGNRFGADPKKSRRTRR
ncbi:SUMF1/EgtB/PvdO family nonheme iron enzyme [Neolewinella lacunae]|uniref:SUMF1/EgtB/PvdO family nonheme iron enzyme n=1 Tax=Neolewinella lacunae TaxID=1517758 RepID=A0A923PIA4_9BACT|nr:SUMF1/EgtB/PvdO family nonheme iron enzyme [Neolewinella lacunae]MBC6993794.1 SUMF1/EgtB/PvdO family nonheme iron enzyme [Neolewinella lacunae]MDN3635315.1 SUMF1/EgtB/PvdO family nonheme iron enzyme [Neolewinella lacunae]